MDRRRVIEHTVRTLAGIERPSASSGEREAAGWIAGRLADLGWTTHVDRERAHGGYWWPLGLLNGVAAAVGVLGLSGRGGRRRRRVTALAGGCAAAAVWDELGGGRLWFRRLFLPRRSTWNVVAEAGDPDGDRAVVFVAHHDAAHTGRVFHPALPRIGMRLAPEAHARSTKGVPILYGAFLGPVGVALGGVLGSRRVLAAGVATAFGAMAIMADIGRSPVVPGANDNLSAVATLVALASALGERPVTGVRVLLVSTGSEESFMEGMRGFATRRLAALPRSRTDVVCLECVGSPELRVIEGEGMLRMRHYPRETRERLAQAAADAGIELTRGLRTVAATDALIAMRAGYSAVTLGATDETKFPSNYHWPTDTPDNLSWESIERATAVCESYVRLVAGRG